MEDPLEPHVIGELLGLIAHDLRNPLSALHSNISFLGSVLDDADDDSREALADAVVSCDGLSWIIDNLDLLSYVLRGRPPMASARLPIAPLVGEVVARIGGAACSHGIEVVVDPALATLQTHVRAHREMLSRALGNLLLNAIQHGRGDSPIRISAREEDGHCYVRIVDAGVPLAEELRGDGFSAAGQLASKGMGGGRYSRGIGLYSAKVAAIAAGADVAWAEPDAGGNAFELRAVVA